MNITEQVSSFTTNHACRANRVQNIHRACDIVNGTIVEPGQTFSLNDTLGPRTPERGFVQAPAFATEEGFFDAYGGGVSQFSTTLFNATFFGGYKDVAHTPHSIYISRYPMGREATLDYPGDRQQVPERLGVGRARHVRLHRHVDHGHVLREQGGAVGAAPRARTSSRRSRSTTEYVDNPLLPAGVEQPISTETGYTGYRVENYRIISRPGQADQRETFRWSYDMRPRKIYRRRAAPRRPRPPRPRPPHRLRPAEHAYAPAVIRALRYRSGTDVPADVDAGRLREAVDADAGLVWIDVEEPTDAELDSLATQLDLSPFAVEDLHHGGQRTKLEHYRDHFHVAIHDCALIESELVTREVDVVFGDGWLLSVRQAADGERDHSPFDVDLAQRRFDAGRRDADAIDEGLLLWAFLDVIVDRYFGIVDQLDDRLDEIEERSSPATATTRSRGRSSTSAGRWSTSGARSCRCER